MPRIARGDNQGTRVSSLRQTVQNHQQTHVRCDENEQRVVGAVVPREAHRIDDERIFASGKWHVAQLHPAEEERVAHLPGHLLHICEYAERINRRADAAARLPRQDTDVVHCVLNVCVFVFFKGARFVVPKDPDSLHHRMLNPAVSRWIG